MAIAPNVLLRDKFFSRVNLSVNPKVNWKAIEKKKHQEQIQRLLMKEFKVIYNGNKLDPDKLILAPGKVKFSCQKEFLALLMLDSNGQTCGAKIYTKKGLIEEAALTKQYAGEDIFPLEYTPLVMEENHGY